MRHWRVAVVTVLGCLLFTGTVVGTSAPDPSDPDARREEVVALVLAQDPRFADLPDYERLRVEASANFDSNRLLGSAYYRALSTVASAFTPWMYDFGYPANWLIEVTLVEDCTPLPTGDGPSSDTAPRPDPCAWRHSWFYRVAPDDTVTLLFEEGHPSR
jgi:hypothetical protein